MANRFELSVVDTTSGIVINSFAICDKNQDCEDMECLALHIEPKEGLDALGDIGSEVADAIARHKIISGE